MKRTGTIISVTVVCLCITLLATALAVANTAPAADNVLPAGSPARAVIAEGASPVSPSDAADASPALPSPGQALDPSDCAGCHPSSGEGFSHEGASGPNGAVTCIDCHGVDHQTIVAARGKVPDGVCGGCHPEQYGL